MMKLVEESAGLGQLVRAGELLHEVSYRIQRYQGFSASGLPIPGLFRIDGFIDPAQLPASAAGLVGNSLVLRLEDGRSVSITLLDPQGHIASEGDGPSRCFCC